MADTYVLIDGTEYRGWERIRVNKSLFELASVLELEVAEGWHADSRLTRIKTGAEFEVLHNGELLLAGHIDGRTIEYDSETHTVQLIGRDFGADLVDCSAYHKKGEWSDTPLLRVLRDLTDGFVTGVIAENGVKLQQIITFAIETGETISDAVNRALSRVGYVAQVDNEKRLVITQTGNAVARPLTLGYNVSKGSLSSSIASRYNSYRVQSELSGGAWSNAQLPKSAKPYVEVRDALIRKPRRLVIWEEFASESLCRKRAEHERAMRAGQGDSLTYTVPGWAQDTGGLWPINAKVPVVDTYMDIDAELLIVGASFSLDENGHMVELLVMHPDVVSAPVEPLKELQGAKWSGAA